MIWNPPQDPHAAVETLSRHLQSEILSACGDTVITPERAAEIARGVAAYCAEIGGAALPSDYLAALVSRALAGAGEESAARHFAETSLPGGRNEELLGTMRKLRGLPPAVWQVFTSGLIRPSRWLANGGVTWVLDLSRLRAGAEDRMELSFLQGLRALLHAVAPIWDEDGGEGVLGLRAVPRLRRAGRRRRQASPDVQGFCQDVMRRLRSRRGWTAIPRVVNLDAAAL
jgi:hypothetical protein